MDLVEPVVGIKDSPFCGLAKQSNYFYNTRINLAAE